MHIFREDCPHQICIVIHRSRLVQEELLVADLKSHQIVIVIVCFLAYITVLYVEHVL